jgi:8-oxo-dGTP pyrophosphatase MutT (NUDIX family)
VSDPRPERRRLPLDPEPPMRTVSRTVVGRTGRYALRSDRARWPNGDEGDYAVLEAPDSVMIVARFPDRTTVLVRQWRYSWGEAAWEVPAGTVEVGEDPAVCAHRELIEEAGLHAGRLVPLGHARPLAAATALAHIFLAEDLTEVPRNLETYERDMITLRLPLDDALEAAVEGEIRHAGSIVALTRAAHA